MSRRVLDRRTFLETAAATAAISLSVRRVSAAGKYDRRRQRHPDQDRPDHSALKGGLALWRARAHLATAYFDMLNEKGGINGRKITFLTMDDAYSAPKCVEATRRLVEQDEVLALYESLRTAPQTANHKYLNGKVVPQLLLNTGASKWNDPKNLQMDHGRAAAGTRPKPASWPGMC